MSPATLVTFGALALAACLYLLSSAFSWAHPRIQVLEEPPFDMVKMGLGTSAKAVRTDLKRSWYDWETLEKKVIVKRREREKVSDIFVQQVQELSTSFFVVDVRWRCDGTDQIKELFVAGIDSGGDSVIERWNFTYPAIPVPVGGDVPIDERPLPSVAREQVYRGNALGRVKTLSPDPDGRFVLFLTREARTLYRIDLPSGTPYVEVDQNTVPFLASVGVVDVSRHVTEGLQYHLYGSSRWHQDHTLPQDVIILRDGDNDGVFDAPEVVDMQTWNQYGYDTGSAWLKICP